MYNDAKKASNNKYLSKFKPISLRLMPEEEEEIRAAAEAAGESRHEYIVQAIRQRMAGGRQTAEGFEAVELPAGYMDVARQAAEIDGVELVAWICKAIEKQNKADNDARMLSEMLRSIPNPSKQEPMPEPKKEEQQTPRLDFTEQARQIAEKWKQHNNG